MCYQTIRVSDYEFLKDWEIMFRKSIYFYGAGDKGRRGVEILAGIDKCQVHGFIETNLESFKKRNQNNCELNGIPVISIDECKKTVLENAIIILATNPKEWGVLLSGLGEIEMFDCVVITWTAFYLAVLFNLMDERVSKYTRDVFYCKNELYMCENKLLVNYKQISALLSPDSVLVYQPKKVGSSTIYWGIVEAGIPSAHMHAITDSYEGVPWFCNKYWELYKKWQKDFVPNRRNKIITMVRDPIARSISDSFDYIEENYVVIDELASDIESSVYTKIEKDIKTGKCGYMFDWFHREIEKVFGINVYDYPFDRQKGYGIIEERNTEILVLKAEKLNSNFDIVKNFIGSQRISNTSFASRNVGNDKAYRYIYDELKKRIEISKEMMDFYYTNNKEFDHFYSKDEAETFIKKWNRV